MIIRMRREKLSDLLQAIRDNEKKGFECKFPYKTITQNNTISNRRFDNHPKDREYGNPSYTQDTFFYMEMERPEPQGC